MLPSIVIAGSYMCVDCESCSKHCCPFEVVWMLFFRFRIFRLLCRGLCHHAMTDGSLVNCFDCPCCSIWCANLVYIWILLLHSIFLVLGISLSCQLSNFLVFSNTGINCEVQGEQMLPPPLPVVFYLRIVINLKWFWPCIVINMLK